MLCLWKPRVIYCDRFQSSGDCSFEFLVGKRKDSWHQVFVQLQCWFRSVCMSVTTVAKIIQHSAVNVAIILSSRPVHSPSGEYGTFVITAKAKKLSLWQECRKVNMSKQLLGILSVTWFCRKTKAHDWGIEIILTHHIISLNLLNEGNLLIHWLIYLHACFGWSSV